jgi:soluble lytic murein transglycosylase-like protein
MNVLATILLVAQLVLSPAGASQAPSGGYYNIPLSPFLQDYIINISEQYELSPELVFAVIKQESNFDIIAVSKTNDYGLMQINKRYAKSFADELGITDFNILDPFQNLQVGIYILAKHRNYWRQQGYSDEEVFDLTLSSYHQGRYRTKVKGVSRGYCDRVYKYKEKLEITGGL